MGQDRQYCLTMKGSCPSDPWPTASLGSNAHSGVTPERMHFLQPFKTSMI